MKSRLSVLPLLVISAVILFCFLLFGCKANGTTDLTANLAVAETGTTAAAVGEYAVYRKETAGLPAWIKDDPKKKNKGPWYQSLYMAFSNDGINFGEAKLFLEHAGVADLLMTRENKLIATFQYFSYTNKDLFDVIAYTVSTDYGNTWSSVKPLKVEGTGTAACDPTLVELEDKTFRLYFTCQEPKDKYPQLYSAAGDSIEGGFVSEGVQLETDFMTLDPAVAWYNGLWHHYTVKHDEGQNQGKEKPGKFVAIHSTSSTGLDFELAEDILLDMGFLGNVIGVEDGLRFYSGQKSAFSNDGYAWKIESGERLKGADPGIARLPDGTFIAIYTSMGK